MNQMLRRGRDDAVEAIFSPVSSSPPMSPLFATRATDDELEDDMAAFAVPLSDGAAAFLRRQVEAASGINTTGEYEQLRAENEQLRGRVADLTGALKARDMEITALRERCQLLLQSIEQQDETIAKIYAVASPATMDALQQQQQHDAKARETTAAQKKKQRSISLAEPIRTVSKDSLVVPPTATMPARPSMTGTTAAPAKAKDSQAVGVLTDAIDRILHISPPPASAPLPNTRASTSTPPRHRRMSLFDDDTSCTTDDTSPSSCSSTLSKSSSGRPFERRESSANEEDFVKSAGFLRKSSRRASGRLSISDFGLLDDAATDEQHSDADGAEQDENQADNQREERPDGDSENLKDTARTVLSRSKSDNSYKKRTRSGSASQRNLFADIDQANTKKKNATNKSANNQDDAAEADGPELTYAEFLERLRLPASRDILETIRLFLASILGPRGDGKPPRSSDFVDYDFYGPHEFRRRCMYFFQSMEELLLNHALWRHASEATLAKARDGVEKYVMDKLHDMAMNQLDECVTWKEEDDRMLRRMKTLSFITPDMLDIKPCMRNEVVWSMAEDELRRINSFRSPGDKINCIVRCCSIIFSVLNLSRGDSGSRPGADDFLPVFIYIVLHSKIPRLHSNCEYIAAYRNPNDLMSKAGYCFVNLRSAVEFLSVVDASMLSVDDDEFNRLYEQEERRLNAAAE